MVRQHLGRFLDEMFAELTALHFHISWAPPPPHEWDIQSLPTACSVCCRLTGSPLLPDCRICGPKQLARALDSDGEGHRFTCRLGVRNYWIPLRVRGETLGIAYLQALDRPTAGPPARKRASSAAPRRLRPAGARVLSRLKFARAVRFLRFIVQHVQISTLADLRLADLTSARCAVIALEKEQARPHEVIEQYHSPTNQVPRHAGRESQPEQIVHHLLECIERDYAKPITLQRYALELEMNAAYVSALFSRSVGIPFKIYLTELRLEKAKALLGDPARTASDVAYAVGYSSENRFRSAFKKATGLCPKLWRETMRTNPPNAA